jgi:N-sulfoglucosamine sulfohydrolase
MVSLGFICVEEKASVAVSRLLICFCVLLLAACSKLDSNSELLFPELPVRPNILWLVAEDLSPIIPAFGDFTVETPNLSRLASEGVKYTQVYSTSGVCAPSRASIATGMYQNRIGAHHMRTSGGGGYRPEGFVPYEALPPSYVKMHSQYFREAGYYKTNNSKEDYQFNAPLTAWDDSSATAHWRGRKEGQPFFSVFNFGVTHESQVWARADQPLLVAEDLEVPVPPYLPDTEIAKRDIRQVYSNIVAMDQEVGEILDQLESDGLLENTIVFWYSDHGGPLPRQKRLLYDSGLKLPLIVRFPNQWHAGETDSQLISFVDFKSTILSLAGITIPSYVDGRPFLGRKDLPQRKYIHAAADRFDSEYDMIRAVSDGRFKYLRNFFPDKPYYLPLSYREQMPIMQEMLKLRDAGQLNPDQMQWFRLSKPVEELFDVATDPYELNNLAQDPFYADKLLELQDELDRWMLEIEDKGLMPEMDYLESIWPNKIQPATEPVQFNLQDSLLTLSSNTQGANIAYQITTSNESPLADTWSVYTKPFVLANDQTIKALAHRVGFKPSEITQHSF